MSFRAQHLILTYRINPLIANISLLSIAVVIDVRNVMGGFAVHLVFVCLTFSPIFLLSVLGWLKLNNYSQRKIRDFSCATACLMLTASVYCNCTALVTRRVLAGSSIKNCYAKLYLKNVYFIYPEAELIIIDKNDYENSMLIDDLSYKDYVINKAKISFPGIFEHALIRQVFELSAGASSDQLFALDNGESLIVVRWYSFRI